MNKLIILFLITLPIFSLARELPVTNQTINDYTNTISESDKIQIDTMIRNYHTKTTNQLGVLLIDSLEGEDIEGFSNRVFTQWGLGTKEKDNGVLLVFAIKDRRFRIEVGQGLEGFLTDVESKRIQGKVKNHLKSGNYGQAVINEIQLITQTIDSNIAREKEYQERNKPLTPKQEEARSKQAKEFWAMIISIAAVVSILISLLATYSSKKEIKTLESKIKTTQSEVTRKQSTLQKMKADAVLLKKQYKGSDYEREDQLNNRIQDLTETKKAYENSIDNLLKIAKKYGVNV